MKLFSSLDARDRKLLAWGAGIVLVLVIAAILTPHDADNDDPTPSSYLSGRHGALAAYELLVESGYKVDRWERPLGELASAAGPQTVVILARPTAYDPWDIKAVRDIVERGGRVLATGFRGGSLLPGGANEPTRQLTFAACKLDPEGLDALAGSGETWMVPDAGWTLGNPAFRVQYACAGEPAVVEYDWKKGHVVWWAGSTPLENASISRANDLNLFLNSLGPRDGHSFYWDESLHGDVHTPWHFASGPALTLFCAGLVGMAALVVVSFSRRSGPLRELPPPARAAPTEFLEALGSLYKNAGAASAAVAAAWERFRRFSLKLCGVRLRKLGAAELAAVIRSRFPGADAQLEEDLKECEDAVWTESVNPRQALRLVQMLHGHERQLAELARPAGHGVGVDSKAIAQMRSR